MGLYLVYETINPEYHDLIWANDQSDAKRLVFKQLYSELKSLMYSLDEEDILKYLGDNGEYIAMYRLQSSQIDDVLAEYLAGIYLYYEWTFEELEVPNNHSDLKLYKCILGDEIKKREDIHILWVKDENELLDQLATIESKNEMLKEYVDHFVSDFTLVDEMARDDNGYLFDDSKGYNDGFRKDIIEKFENDKMKMNEYAVKVLGENIRGFFKYRPEFADIYVNEFNKGKAISKFNDDMYWYVARHSKKWQDGWRIEEVEVPGMIER